jgi:hypothetical protein
MKKMKRTLVLLLVVLTLLSTGTAAVAADAEKSGDYGIMYIGIQSISAYLNINGSGLATCGGDVTLSNNTYRVYLTVALEQSTGGGWSTVTYWMSSGSGYLGTSILEYYYVSYGTYRVRSTATVFDSQGSFIEQASVYSPIRNY